MKSNRKLMIVAIPLLVILAALAAYEYVYLEVVSDVTAVQDEQDMKMKTLTKYVNLIAQKADFEKQLEEQREQAKGRAVRFVTGDPISIASANMQELVKGIVTGRGGTITSERIGKPEPLRKEPAETAPAPSAAADKKPGLKKKVQATEASRIQVISISIDATIPDITALGDILYSIESRTPDLVIKELDIRVRNFRDPRELLVRINVSGLYEGK